MITEEKWLEFMEKISFAIERTAEAFPKDADGKPKPTAEQQAEVAFLAGALFGSTFSRGDAEELKMLREVLDSWRLTALADGVS